MKPNALTIPAIAPMIKAAAGDASKSQLDPMATPPARVALRTTSMSSAPSTYLEYPQAVMQLAEIESTVFTITLYWNDPEARAPLKLGQYIHKKIVPTIAIS